MNRTRVRVSFVRTLAVVAASVALLASLLRFTGDAPCFAAIQMGLTAYGNDFPRFPRKKSVYQSTGTTGYPTATVAIELLSLKLSGPPTNADNVPLPPPGSEFQVDSFFDIFTELHVGGGGGGGGRWQIDSFFDITYRVGGGGGGGGGLDGTWPIEMLAMEIKGFVDGPSGPIPVTIRESPTLASTGQDRMTTTADTLFIDSFFDVFTELSLDGGATWHTGNAPLRMELTAIVPEPGAMVLALGVVVGMVGIARRRR